MPVTCNWLTVCSTCSEANAQHTDLLSLETHRWMTETLIFKSQSRKGPPECCRIASDRMAHCISSSDKDTPKIKKKKKACSRLVLIALVSFQQFKCFSALCMALMCLYACLKILGHTPDEMMDDVLLPDHWATRLSVVQPGGVKSTET